MGRARRPPGRREGRTDRRDRGALNWLLTLRADRGPLRRWSPEALLRGAASG
ncbi:hypothetical protein FHR32_007867 [Streptosporangium album]|uniref:Uncharacterized protein n=1 Tax=Streptosporangium album TaxID=47479 RepID=A0A7W7WD92_9ACTN|nr:hypothetical protein [Streptosporangium album]